jgi:hypothetical protein
LDAVITSFNLLREEKEAKAIILLSDGQINIDTIQDAIDYANQKDVVVNTIGIGTKEGGETSLGVISKLDEEALQSLAYNTEGGYFSVTNKEELRKSFQEVLKVTKKKVSISVAKYLMIASIFLFIFIYFLLSSSYRRIP